MVKRAGDRSRATTPTHHSASQQYVGQNSGGGEPCSPSAAAAARLSPEPGPPNNRLDIASWAAQAADALSHSSMAGRPHQPTAVGSMHPPGPRGTDASSLSSASQQQQRLLFQQQQQQQALLQAASLPNSRRVAGSAAAAAAAGGMPQPASASASNNNNTYCGPPGQRPAGPFSPLFTGGVGMWSSQDVEQRGHADPAALAAAAGFGSRQQQMPPPPPGAAPGSRQSSGLGAPSTAGSALTTMRRGGSGIMSSMAPPAELFDPEPQGAAAGEQPPLSMPNRPAHTGAQGSSSRPQTGGRTSPLLGQGAGAGAPGSTISRASFSSHHSVLSAGSYQAAAAAAAAAVVAANARSRGLSPVPTAMQEVERTFVAAAATAAANRAMGRTPSPGPLRPGFEQELMRPSSRGPSPGRGGDVMMAAAAAPSSFLQQIESAAAAGYQQPASQWSPGRAVSPHRQSPASLLPEGAAAGLYAQVQAAAAAAAALPPGSDISSSASRPVLTAAALAQLSGSRCSPGSKASSGAGINRAAPGQAPAAAPPPAAYMAQWGAQGSGVPVGWNPKPWETNPAALPMPVAQFVPSGRARGHCRSSSDGGAVGAPAATGIAEESMYRPRSDSRLQSSLYQQQPQHEQQSISSSSRRRRQQQQRLQNQEDSGSGSGSDEEPARWHATLARVQQQQQPVPRKSPREAKWHAEDADDMHAHVQQQRTSRAASPHAAQRAPSPSGKPSGPPSPTEERRCSQHSSSTVSRTTAAAPAAAAGGKAKYQAYSGQAALLYNPKADKSMSYLRGTTTEAEQQLPGGHGEYAASREGPEGGNNISEPERSTPATPRADAWAAEGVGATSLHMEQQRPSPRGSLRDSKGSTGAANEGAKQAASAAAGGLKYSGSGKLQVRVMAGSDSDDGSARRPCGISKKALWCALTMLLLVVMAGVGVGVGMAFAKGKHASGPVQGAAEGAAAPAAASLALFGLAARPMLPGLSSEQRCKLWFGTNERLQHYQQVFAGAYAQALSLPASSIQVTGVSCDGRAMLSSSSSSSGGAPRSLLAAAGAAQPAQAAPDSLLAALLGQQQQQQPSSAAPSDASSGASEVVTQFSITASGNNAAALSGLSSRVTSSSPSILAAPLSQFFQTSAQVQAASQLDGWRSVSGPAAADVPSGANAAAAAVLPGAAQQLPPLAPQQQVASVPSSSSGAPPPAAQQQQGQAAAGIAAPASGKQGKQSKSSSHHKSAAAAPAGADAGVDEDYQLDADEQPIEPPARQQAAAAPAPRAPKASSRTKQVSAKAAGQQDDYYPLDSEDAAAQSSDDEYADLDPSEMPIEPPPPGQSPSPEPADEARSSTVSSGTGAGTDDDTQWVEFYDNAPTCSAVPTIANSVYDGSGRLWGMEKKAMCVFRATSPQWAPVTWKEAKACSGVPSASNSVYDESGKLWGWQDNSNCAFKLETASAKPAQPTWKSAPACVGQASSSNSVTDTNGKKWGWSSGKTCAFRQAATV